MSLTADAEAHPAPPSPPPPPPPPPLPSTYPPSIASSVRVRKTPMFSGIFAPLAIVLVVPGLTSKWYADIDENGLVIRYINNPVILTVGLAISLAAAVVANLTIVLRFLEVLSPTISIAVSIAAFGLHDLINLVALAVFGGIYGPLDDGLSLSASYWMVCASTAASLLVTASLVADYLRTANYRQAGSGLTQRQKTLVLAVMSLLIYLSLGSLVFVFLIDIDFISALYFSTATILSVGFGDIIPPSTGARVVVIVYAPTGIVLVALVVASARDTILESFRDSLQKRMAQHRQRILERRAARRDNRAAFKTLRRALSNAKSASIGVAGPTVVVGEPATRDADPAAVRTGEPAGLLQLQPSSDKDDGTTTDAMLDEIRQMQLHLDRHRQEVETHFRALEERSQREARSEVATKIGLAFLVFVAFWLVGATAFKYTESWSYFDAFWFCFIAMITIGYGDLSPRTQIGRGVFVIWGLMGVAVLTILLAVIQDAFGSLLQGVLAKSTARLFDRIPAKLSAKRGSTSDAAAARTPGQHRGRHHGAGSDPARPAAHRRRFHRHSKHEHHQRDKEERLEYSNAYDPEDGSPEDGPYRFSALSLPEPTSSKTSDTARHPSAEAAASIEERSGKAAALDLARTAMQFFNQSLAVLDHHDESIRRSLAAFPRLRRLLILNHTHVSDEASDTASLATGLGDEHDGVDARARARWLEGGAQEALEVMERDGHQESADAVRMACAHARLEETLMGLLQQIDRLSQRRDDVRAGSGG